MTEVIDPVITENPTQLMIVYNSIETRLSYRVIINKASLNVSIIRDLDNFRTPVNNYFLQMSSYGGFTEAKVNIPWDLLLFICSKIGLLCEEKEAQEYKPGRGL